MKELKVVAGKLCMVLVHLYGAELLSKVNGLISFVCFLTNMLVSWKS